MTSSSKKALGRIVVAIAAAFGLITVFAVINFFSNPGGQGLSGIAIEAVIGGTISALGIYYGMKLVKSGTLQIVPKDLFELLPE